MYALQYKYIHIHIYVYIYKSIGKCIEIVYGVAESRLYHYVWYK